MTIMGQSQSGTIIDAQGADRIFIIPGGVSVTLQNMTIKNGKSSSSGGWFIISGNGDDGGAIYNAGKLQINGCKLSGNSAGDGDYSTLSFGGNGGSGGAIYNSGILTINNSIFTDNRAGDGGGSGLLYGGNGGNGGSIYNTGTLQISTSIFTDNRAGNGGSGLILDGIGGNGGAIQSGGILLITGSTIRNNSAGQYHIGGIYNTGTAEIHFNYIIGNYNGNVVSSNGLTNATLNYWGTNSAPLGVGSNVNINPWLVFSFTANPLTVNYGDDSQISANFLYDSNGVYHDPVYGHIIDGRKIYFDLNWGTMDIINPSSTTLNGEVKGIYHANWILPAPSTALVYATLYEVISGIEVRATISIPINILSFTSINELNSNQNPDTITTNTKSKIKAANKTIGMQKTGLSLPLMVLAILMVIGGFLVPKRK
ncbi:MAG: hypothetical protein ACPK7O_05820 [Methanobacterium sp.]